MSKHSTIGVGWDVGGWNCDNNSKSRDALVIVGALGELLGQPWRGNLRHVINEAVRTADFLAKIFGLCRLASGFSNSSVTVAIDAPHGTGLPQRIIWKYRKCLLVKKLDTFQKRPRRGQGRWYAGDCRTARKRCAILLGPFRPLRGARAERYQEVARAVSFCPKA